MARRGKIICGGVALVFIVGLCTAAVILLLTPRLARSTGSSQPKQVSVGSLAPEKSPAVPPASVPKDRTSVSKPEPNEEKDLELAARGVRASVKLDEKDPLSELLKKEMTAEEKDSLSKRGILCNSSRSLMALRHDPAVILLRNAIIDTSVIAAGGPSIEIPERFQAEKDTTRFIVLFSEPLSEKQKAALSAVGATIEHYLPNRAYAISADAETIKKVKAMNGVRHVEPFHPYFKMSGDVQAYLMGTADEETAKRVEAGKYDVLFFSSDNAVKELRKLGAEVILMGNGGNTEIGRVDCSPDILYEIVRCDAVKWVESRVPFRAMNDLANKTIRGNVIKLGHSGLDGSGVTICVVDTGIDHTHRAFAQNPNQNTSYYPTKVNSRIVYYEVRTNAWSESNGQYDDHIGHGSHVSGSILGNGGWSMNVLKSPGSGNAPYATNQFAGIAPAAQLVMLEDFNSFDATNMTKTAYTKGGRIMSHSWGASVYDYGVASRMWDQLVRDGNPSMAGNQEMITFFAAGNDGGGNNDGTGGTAGTVGQPGNAKNVIAIGAVEQRRLCDNLNVSPYNSVPNTDSDWQIADYSSRGPTPDGRIKPDVVAPGSYVMSVQTKDVNFDIVEWPTGVDRDFRNGNLDSGTNYAVMSGTSMSTPLAAGAAALVYQYYMNTYGKAPSPAMMKAMMVNGAVGLLSYFYEMEPYGPSPCHEGWGMIDLSKTIDGPGTRATDEMMFYDQEAGDVIVQTGESVVKTYTVAENDAGGLKVTLAWTDVAGTPGAGAMLVNDLDLVVTAPDGTVYQGNYMGRRVWGTTSYELSAYNTNYSDRANNVESVIIRHAAKGSYKIEVKGYQVPQPSQDFALVITKGVSSLGDSGGAEPALTLDGNGLPVLANIGSETGNPGDWGVMTVRRWVGSLGEGAEYGTWRLMKDKWFDYGTEWKSETISGSVLDSQVRSPSIAINTVNGNVYVAWVYKSFESVPDSIYLRYWNGTQWGALGGSYENRGICNSDISKDASSPSVGIAADGQPVVAYIQKRVEIPNVYKEVVVKKWDGSNWVTLDGSDKGIVCQGVYASSVNMVMDNNGRPVLVWRDGLASTIRCYRWNGSSWSQVASDLGSYPSSSGPPKIALDGSSIYVTWLEIPTGGNETKRTVRVAVTTGGSWASIGGSMIYPGISGTADSPYNQQIAAARGEVFVAWQSGDTNNNRVLVKKWTGSQWTGISGSDSNGVVNTGGRSILNSMVVHTLGYPILSIQNNRIGTEDTIVYALVGDIEPPPFLGISSAVGTVANTVTCLWTRVIDPAQTITYHIYRTPGSGWSSADSSIPSASDFSVISAVFGNKIASVTDTNTYTVTGLTADRVWYFGVRAANEAGLVDNNTVLKLAGPWTMLGDADGDWLVTSNELLVGTSPSLKDTDGDGMWDGWEWYYSTNNPAHTNSLAMNPLDNGTDNLATTNENDGTSSLAREADLDGDGMMNFEEFNYWLTHAGINTYSAALAANPTNWWLNPTSPDTDGDGMWDGWEVLNSFDPGWAGDGTNDPDGDGVTNITEFLWGSNPYFAESDGDGLSDSNEIAIGTSPGLADTDLDGLQDGFEAGVGGDPLKADTDGDGISDGDEYQLGYNNITNSGTNMNLLLFENFEGSTWTNWTHSSPSVDMWHRTTADPDPPAANTPPPPTPRYLYDHSTNHSFRCANDPLQSNTNATYDQGGALVYSALNSPPFNPAGAGAVNLYVEWNEHYETEAEYDICEVLASRDGGTNWFLVRTGVSGITTGWVHRVADMSAFAGNPNVRVRFLFRTLNTINNAYRGWYVDDVRIYGGTRISGVVRDVNGASINSAVIYAIGRGGVTNTSQGHAYVLPGKIFGQVLASTNGSYTINGLYQGNYYVKAAYSGYKAEFWNGVLYTNTPFYTAFGRQINPGVTDRQLAEGSGAASLTNLNATTNCNFELEAGASRGFLGIMTESGNYNVYLNQTSTNVFIWNGETNTNTVASVPYTTTNTVSLAIRPDWETNNIKPSLIGDIAEGNYNVYLHPDWTNMPYVPQISVAVRDGEITLVTVRTNQSSGKIYVKAAGSETYPIYIDGRNIQISTTGSDSYTNILVGAGDHEVALQPSGSSRWIAPKQVTVPSAGRVFVSFTLNEVMGAMRDVRIETKDIHANAVTGAEVFVNGILITTNHTLSGKSTTPLVVKNLTVGSYWVTVRRDGYRSVQQRTTAVYEGVTNTVTFMLHEADTDYDLVGDAAEMDGYTNIFRYSRNDDPDFDGVANLVEYDQFRLHNIRMNMFDSDSDDDRMGDGVEIGYDGRTNWLALSVLETNAAIGASSVKVYFRGRFLEGENTFNTNLISSSNLWISIEGDLCRVTQLGWNADYLGTPVMVFSVPSMGVASNVVSVGHDFNALVYADTFPDTVDTEGDGMWDGFEFMYRTNGLNPIETGPNDADPDNDGLSNLNEFLGADETANTNDWINPGNPDSDGDIMPDGWEIQHELNPLNASDASLDPDGDGLVNLSEWQWLTDPQNSDSDNDGLTDGLEVNTYGCNPLLLDSDYDGLIDGREVWDTDLDPLTGIDGGFFPNWDGGDLDHDGYLDGPTDWDTDGDGMPDGFEVLDIWGNVRPVGQRLDPYDPTDGPLDYDGDGLSNLEEYLVRDALIGKHPSTFNPSYAGVIWDYSTDPFDADSDNDGMPDGFEVWDGLYPVDPLLIGTVEVVRVENLWLFGDVDFDGVVNQNEYDVRFLLDPNADSNVLAGSTHPWLADTDGDGLGDGEEIKAFRSNPLNQDTDADGLMDGSKLTDRMGEVHSSTNLTETNQYDRALNDLWALVPLPGLPYPLWVQVFSSMPPSSNYPAPRWGGAGAVTEYTVLDSKKGEYVGQPVSGIPVGDAAQILLQNLTFTVFGGRDGVRHFNEVWEYDGTNRWTSASMPRAFSNLSECATATKIYTLDTYDRTNAPTKRPRPGGPAGFQFYDGDPETDPLEILWRTKPDDAGSLTLPNWSRTLVFGGWDERHQYDGGFVHDYVEDYTHTYSVYVPSYYKSTDYTNITITYGWIYAADAFEWDSQTGLATNYDSNGNIQIGATTSNFIYTGINIENVLNTLNDTGAYSVVRAILRVKLINPGANFQVRVLGELDDIKTETVADQTEHSTLTSPETYYTVAGQPSKNRPSGRIAGGMTDWATNSSESIVTISNRSSFVTYDIDVTTQVVAMLNAAYLDPGPPEVKANWEFGNSMGFLIVGMTNSTGTAYINEGSEKLWIWITNPHYTTPSNMAAFKENGVDMVMSNAWVREKDPYAVIHPHQRKSTAMAYSAALVKFVLFGGVDGVRVLDDTWTSTDGFDGWTILSPATRPPARWGHCMVESLEGVIMFGGFDSWNRPLNDLWEYDETGWREAIPEDGEVPPPRGGAAMGYAGGWISMFGGTDGEKYFNDTWLLELPGMTNRVVGSGVVTNTIIRWTNIQPLGEQSRSPSPRAFPAYNNQGGRMYIFGGRTGTLPTGSDTDSDWINDGIEHDLGGPAAGRDPRANALIAESALLNTNAAEKIPYAFKRLGGISLFGLGFRSAIMDFESLKVYPASIWLTDDQEHAFWDDLPIEGYHEDWGPFHVWDTGYDAYEPDFTDLWWHRFGGGDPSDLRDEWELGEPHSEGLSSNAAPSVAHSGRWCYGTDLNGTYADDAVMELYTPLFDLTVPATDSTDPSNMNGFYLVFYEWLDLADSKDMVRIQAVRPSTPADIVTRVSGVNPPRPVISILPNRNNAYNTAGAWRRVVVPLEPVANETNLYLRFVLQSDASGHAGGWYIDDVTILQAGRITGTYTNGGIIYLFGANGTNFLASASAGPNGDFGFDFLASGSYMIVAGDGSAGTNTTILGNNSWSVGVQDFELDEIVIGISINSPVRLMWNAIPGMTYKLQYSTPETITSANPWTTLATVIPTDKVGVFIDYDSESAKSRFYRVVLIGVSP